MMTMTAETVRTEPACRRASFDNIWCEQHDGLFPDDGGTRCVWMRIQRARTLGLTAAADRAFNAWDTWNETTTDAAAEAALEDLADALAECEQI